MWSSLDIFLVNVQLEDKLRSVQAENQLLGRVVQDLRVSGLYCNLGRQHADKT